MDGTFAKNLVNRFTGYWIYKSRHLPIGTDFRVDVTRKLDCGKIRTVFDVGANFGQTYRTFRRHFPDACIYCFEPVTDTFAVLKTTLADDANARGEQLAFGSAPEIRTIRVFPHAAGLNSLRDHLMNSAHDARDEIVQVDTIDRYCAANGITNIDLLKIDTEGFEVPVLEGARGMLSRSGVSMILAEVGFDKHNDRNSPFSNLVDFLLTFDYRFFGLYEVTHDSVFGVAFANALFVRGSLLYPGLGK
jgi:FkbM family methyltransferase